MHSVSSFFETSDGVKIYVKFVGVNDPAKPLLIALHGAPGLSDHKEPESSFGFLASRFRVLVYDARGSGRSEQKGPYTHRRWTADADELRNWAGADKIVLAGGSYGGFVALEYALAYPDRLSALILRDTWAYGLRGALNCLKGVLTSDRIKVDADRQVRVWSGAIRDNEDFADSFAEILPIYTPGPPEAVATVRVAYNLHYETHNFAFSYNQPRFDLRPVLKDVSAPTLVVVGRHDPIAPVEYSEEIHQGIPGSQLAIFENSGHSPPSDEPKTFQRRLWQFLAAIAL